MGQYLQEVPGRSGMGRSLSPGADNGAKDGAPSRVLTTAWNGHQGAPIPQPALPAGLAWGGVGTAVGWALWPLESCLQRLGDWGPASTTHRANPISDPSGSGEEASCLELDTSNHQGWDWGLIVPALTVPWTLHWELGGR